MKKLMDIVDNVVDETIDFSLKAYENRNIKQEEQQDILWDYVSNKLLCDSSDCLCFVGDSDIAYRYQGFKLFAYVKYDFQINKASTCVRFELNNRDYQIDVSVLDMGDVITYTLNDISDMDNPKKIISKTKTSGTASNTSTSMNVYIDEIINEACDKFRVVITKHLYELAHHYCDR